MPAAFTPRRGSGFAKLSERGTVGTTLGISAWVTTGNDRASFTVRQQTDERAEGICPGAKPKPTYFVCLVLCLGKLKNLKLRLRGPVVYGMVMKSIESYVLHHLGPSAWSEVAAENGLEYTSLIATEGYPDEQTVGLVVSSARLFDLAPAEMLRKLGDYWIDYALASPMRELMTRNGRDPGEFITGLNALHVRTQLVFPQMRPPEFEALPDSDRSVRVLYSSPRTGLEPFVEGLLMGVARMFGVQGTVERLPASGADVTAEFRFCWTPAHG
jgi:Haem-NO-binding